MTTMRRLPVPSIPPVGTRATDPGPRKLRLVPGKPLYVLANGVCDVGRFARMFRAAWVQIPPAARRAMLGYWRQGPVYRGWDAPRIGVLADWPNRKGHAGECGFLDHELRFWAAVVETYPPELVTMAVAHELAHVFQHASRTEFGKMGVRAVEDQAWEIVCSWGFPLPSHPAGEPVPSDSALAARVRRWSRAHQSSEEADPSRYGTGLFLSERVHTPEFARAFERVMRKAGREE